MVDFVIKLAGQHSILNALAVIAAAIELEVDLFALRQHLENFIGAARRLQLVGQFKGAPIIDDFAHHPTEIRASIEAVRQLYPLKKLIVVFHPHTFSRTTALFNDFVQSLDNIDALAIVEIFGSTREATGSISSKDIVEALRLVNDTGVDLLDDVVNTKTVAYCATIDEAEQFVRDRAAADNVIVLMGAGEATKIGEKLLKK